MRHPPSDRSLFVIAREQFGFVGVAGFLPNAFPVRIAPGQHVIDRVERRYRVMLGTAREARRKAVTASCRIIEDGGFWDAFGHDQILARLAVDQAHYVLPSRIALRASFISLGVVSFSR